MQKARCHSRSCSNRLQAYGFRVYFTPLFTVLFTFPSRYQFTIGLSGVFSLTGWSRWIQSRFHVPRPTQDTHKIYKTVPIRDYHSLWCVFPNTSNPALQPISGSYNPHIAVTIWVWAVPISLATTLGITFVFFSSAYLDVSVQRVCPSLRCSTSSMYWVAPFGYLRINSYVPIHATFRSLSRPSSPLRAQASPIRPYITYLYSYVVVLSSQFLVLSYKNSKFKTQNPKLTY